jgi:hypothetical protein
LNRLQRRARDRMRKRRKKRKKKNPLPKRLLQRHLQQMEHHVQFLKAPTLFLCLRRPKSWKMNQKKRRKTIRKTNCRTPHPLEGCD